METDGQSQAPAANQIDHAEDPLPSPAEEEELENNGIESCDDRTPLNPGQATLAFHL